MKGICPCCGMEKVLDTQSIKSLGPRKRCFLPLLSNSEISNIIFTISNQLIRETGFRVAFRSEICEVDVHIQL